MIINNICIEISESDLQSGINKYLGAEKNLSDVKAVIEGDKIILSAKYEVPVVGAMEIKVSFLPEVKDGDTVILNFDFIGVGGMVTGFILKFLDSKTGDIDFIERDQNSLVIKLAELLKYFNISGEINLNQLSVSNGILTADGKGSYSL